MASLLLFAGAERVPNNFVIQALRLAPWPKCSRRRPLIRSTTHTPDHPVDRSLWPQWFVDLAAHGLQQSASNRSVFHPFSRALSQHCYPKHTLLIRPQSLRRNQTLKLMEPVDDNVDFRRSRFQGAL